MLAGAEGGGRVDFDGERAWRRPCPPMRAVHKKSPDAQGRKGAAIFGEPVALRQSLFDDIIQPAAGTSRGKRQPDFDIRIESGRARISLDPP
jgi:hypothetical protein